MIDPIVIVGIARTPMGAMAGSLSGASATELGACAIRSAMIDSKIDSDQVSEVLMGCVLPAGLGQAPARQAALKAGLGSGVPCTTVNKVCGSGMKTLMLAEEILTCGNAEIVVAGGMESMSNAPYLLAKARTGYRLGHGEMLDHLFTDGLEDAYEGQLMGHFAEATAAKYSFTREQQDAFALESLRKAQAAIANGFFQRELIPVTIKTSKGETLVGVDEQPGNARPEKIPQLRPAFKKDGTVTAANSSSISDGAAALVLMRKSTALAKSLKPLAMIVGSAQYAQEPEWFTTAPVMAIKKLLAACQWSIDDVDLFEINEAFAVVTMAAAQDLNIPSEKINIHGGACALGHPLGASGARIVVTLIAALARLGKKRGVASLCIGGGEAVAMAIEMI